jgi:hypothetical protein
MDEFEISSEAGKKTAITCGSGHGATEPLPEQSQA